MKENWFAILMFSIIFGILGFLLGRTLCNNGVGCCAPQHQCYKKRMNFSTCELCYIYYSEDLLEGDNSSVETLRQTEGTIILHINFAISMDQELGKEFIKFLKV